jgi:hypothetical protein
VRASLRRLYSRRAFWRAAAGITKALACALAARSAFLVYMRVDRAAFGGRVGVGEGAPGRRSRARNATGKSIAATEDLVSGHGVHLFGTLLTGVNRVRNKRYSVDFAGIGY